MKKLITLIVTIALSIPSQSQYTQNIDSLSKKEIKNLIMNLDKDNEVRTRLEKYRVQKGVGGFLLIAGTVLIIATSSSDDNAYNHEVDLDAFLNGILGAIISTTGLIVHISASNKMQKVIDSYSRQTRKLGFASIKIRDDSKILKSYYSLQ
ncbi:MAG: hypothetical protein ABJG47_13175 [Ekhidna sp.]